MVDGEDVEEVPLVVPLAAASVVLAALEALVEEDLEVSEAVALVVVAVLVAAEAPAVAVLAEDSAKKTCTFIWCMSFLNSSMDYSSISFRISFSLIISSLLRVIPFPILS